jgi:hypothetical protein
MLKCLLFVNLYLWTLLYGLSAHADVVVRNSTDRIMLGKQIWVFQPDKEMAFKDI